MFPELSTQRCRLRKIVPSDQQEVFEGLSDEEVIKYYGVSYSTYNDTAKQMAWFENLLTTDTGIWWAITMIGEEKMIGACGFNNTNHLHKKTEMGYWLLRQSWKKGIMNEVLPAIVAYAFEVLKLHRIEATVEVDNIPSIVLLGKLGFNLEGTFKESEFKNGKFIDLEYFGLVNDGDEAKDGQSTVPA